MTVPSQKGDPADRSPILSGFQITRICMPLSVLLIYLYQGAFIYCGLERWGGGVIKNNYEELV